MRKILTFAAILAAAISCNKAEIIVPNKPLGDSVTLTVTSSKVGIDGNSYVFEPGDRIFAKASNGSTATLSNTDDAPGTFSGTFSEPVSDDATIDLSYNCDGFTQNGKPWLSAHDEQFSRDSDGRILLNAEFSAPAGVRAIAITTGFDATVDFHAKSPVSGFDGKTFSGNAAVTGLSVSAANGFTTFVNVPDGLEGGFYLKVSDSEARSMFKSYASGSVISQNTRVSVNEFVPVDVQFEVNISGFPTSYSYYAANEGIEGISAKDVAKANSISNDWMGSGSASYVMTSTGIPSRLLTFESFTLSVDGKEYASSEAGSSRKEAGTPIVVEATTGHAWGQKDITATVRYKDVEGNEYTATKTITRHITGLPYVAAPPKDNGDNPWTSNYALWLNQITFSADNVALSATSRAPAITSPAFHIPEELDVTVNTNHSLANAYIFFGDRKTVFEVAANNETIISNGDECTKLAMSGNGSLAPSGNGKLSPAGNTVTCKSTYTMAGPSVTIFSVAINYR